MESVKTVIIRQAGPHVAAATWPCTHLYFKGTNASRQKNCHLENISSWSTQRMANVRTVLCKHFAVMSSVGGAATMGHDRRTDRLYMSIFLNVAKLTL